MKEPITGDLGTIHGFDRSDLTLNQAGVMSRPQAARFQHQAIVRFVQMGMLVAAPVALAAVLAASGLVDGYDSLAAKMLLILEASMALLGLVAGWDAMRNMGDARDRRVEVDEGYVVCTGRGARDYYFYYRTMRRQYRVPKAACEALDKHQRYRIYCAPRTKTLVAIEPHGR